jgi:PEP-CTERM/exosortase A-associated glycosyltransferase
MPIKEISVMVASEGDVTSRMERAPARTSGTQSGTLRVLHVLDHSLPIHTGYTFRSANILNEQRRRGWSPVAVTSPKHEADQPDAAEDFEEIGGFRYYRTGASASASLPFQSEIRLMRKLAKRIGQVARIEKPDILHAHSPVLNGLPALWVGNELSIPVVYEIRAFWEDAAVDHRTYSENSLKYKTVRALETWVCRHAAQVAVLCNGLKQDLIARGIPEDKLTVVFNGINPDDFRLLDADADLARRLGVAGKKVLGFLGSFYRYEGLSLLVDAMAKLASKRRDVVLLLVGGGEVEGELRAQVAKLGLQESVIFTGRIPHEEIPKVYALVDVLVYPRFSMRLTELVTPLKPLEAMAMCKPLVASDIGGHRELIRHGATGILSKPGDVNELVGAVELLLDDGALRARLSMQGYDWVRANHSWQRTTGVYAEIYAKALRS